MSMQKDYKDYLARREAGIGANQTEQEKRCMHPFRIYGPVWYVGDDWVCVHLIDTGDGLLLIDAGNCGAAPMLVNAIWEAGFKPSDVKWIVISHGHYDHFGAVPFFRNMFGTKIYLGAPDAKMFRERPWLSFVQKTQNDNDAIFTPDAEIQDGDVLTFGNLQITCKLCPGHTEGVVSLFFDVDGEEGVKRVGYYGGFGFNTLQKDYLIGIGDTGYKMRKRYLDSLAKVRDEKVEIMLGNHAKNNQTPEKRQRMLDDPGGPNPFVDPDCWKKYLDKMRDAMLKLMADPKQN